MSRGINFQSIRPAPISPNWGDLDHAFTARPEATAAAMTALSSWGLVERAQLHLFVHLMGGNDTVAAEVFKATGKLVRDRAIEAVAEKVAAAEEQDLLAKLTAATKRAQKDRDRLAHWSWTCSRSIMNGFVLYDPADVLRSKAPPKSKALVFTTAVLRDLANDHAKLALGWSFLKHVIEIRQNLERNGQLPASTPKRQGMLARIGAVLGELPKMERAASRASLATAAHP
jgi:hypothetical protein